MKVGLVGPFPPPRGGVSVHILRLIQTLSDDNNQFAVFNTNTIIVKGGRLRRRLSYLVELLKFTNEESVDLLHLHVSQWWERAYILLLARTKRIKTVMTIHSLRDDLDNISFVRKIMIGYALNADYLILTGELLHDKLLSHFPRENNLCTMTPFIPPITTEKLCLPEYVEQFIKQHDFIIAANASNMNFYQNEDLYGLDMLIELCGKISQLIDVGFVYCLTNLTDKQYFNKMQARITELNIEKSFLIVIENMEFWPVLIKSQIFIRPTCTDSYGISLAEALHMGIPSIASDVCQRASGSVLFKSRDGQDLYIKTIEMISHYAEHKSRVQNLEYVNCAYEIRKIYQRLLAG